MRDMRGSEALLAVFAVLSVGLRSSGAPGELRGNAAGSESSAAVWTTCPNRCRCEEERADCSDLGLREVPSNLSVFTSYLDLSMNNLSDMSSGGLSNLPFLEELRLAGNDLSFIPRGAFSGLFNLKVLMLQNNQLKSVPADAFNNLHNLQSLHLDANHISSIPPGCFSGLRSLRHLWLDDNSLTEVPVAALSELPTLQAMTLALNRISHVPDHAFSKLGRLVVLHLNNNRIVSMGTSCFHGLWSLETLDLNYNSLVEFPSAVRSLRNLKELGFHSNNIQSIPEHAFTGNPSLISIFFYNNPIQSVGRSAFQNLPELRTLSLNGAANLTEFPDLTGTKRLESLTITEARITHLPASVCDQLPNLQLLDLSFNRIQIVPSFSGCENIQKIDLHHNEIKELKENTFTGLMLLRSLDLSWNRLFSVEPDSFSVLPALSKLDLSSNQLSSLPLTGLQSLTHIRLAGNNQLMDLIPREDLPRVRVMELPYAFQCCAFVSSSLAFSVSLVLFDLLCFLIMTFAYIRLYCRANKAPPPSEEEVALIRHVAWLLFSDSLLFLPVAFLSFSSLLRLPVAGPEAAKGVLLLVAPLPACVNPLLYLLFTPLAREELAALTKRTCVGTLALKLRRRGAAEGRQLDSTYDDDAEKQSCDSTQALVVVEGVKEEDEGEGRGRGGSKTHQSGAFVAKRH